MNKFQKNIVGAFYYLTKLVILSLGLLLLFEFSLNYVSFSNIQNIDSDIKDLISYNIELLLYLFILFLGVLSGFHLLRSNFLHKYANTIKHYWGVTINSCLLITLTAFTIGYYLHPGLSKLTSLYLLRYPLAYLIIFVISYFLLYLIKNISERTKNQGLKVISDNLSDEPIEYIEQDLLGRKNFIDGIYNKILNINSKNSFVIAIEGKWGEGKTSVLRILRNRLLNNSNAVVFFFNPWFFETPADLIKSFLDDLDKSFSTKFLSNDIHRNFKSYEKVILNSLADKVGIKSLDELFNSSTLIDRKEKLAQTLSSYDTKFIVIIDDLDRIETDEAKTIFKLVKLIADLPNIIFVLGVDVEILKDTSGVRNHYLEKIIQKTFKLPKIDAQTLDTYLFTALDRLFEGDIDGLEQVKQFRSTYLGLKTPLSNLRQINLYISEIESLLTSEVRRLINLQDLLLIEILDVIAPNVLEDMWLNPEYYIIPEWDYYSPNVNNFRRFYGEGEKRNNAIKNHINAVLVSASEDKRSLIISMLSELFYAVKTAYTSSRDSHSDLKKAMRALKRIMHPDMFQWYFIGKMQGEKIYDSEIEGLIKDLNKNEEIDSILNQALAKYQSDDNLREFIHKMDLHYEKIDLIKLPVLIKNFYTFADTLPLEVKENFNMTDFSQIFVLIYRSLDRFSESNKDSLRGILEDITLNAPLFYVARMMNWLESDEGFYNVSRNADKPKIQGLFLKRVESTLVTPKVNIFEVYPRTTGYILDTWGKYDQLKMNEYVFELVEKTPVDLAGYLTYYLNYFNDEHAKIRYDELISVLDEAKISDFIQSHPIDENSLGKLEKKALALFKNGYEESQKVKRGNLKQLRVK